MTEPSSYQDLLEKHSQVLLLLEAAHQEIKRQAQVIQVPQARIYGSSSERLDPLQDQLAFPDGLLGKAEPPSAKTSEQEEGDESEKQKRTRRTKAETRPRNIPVVIEKIIEAQEVTAEPDAYRQTRGKLHRHPRSPGRTTFSQAHHRQKTRPHRRPQRTTGQAAGTHPTGPRHHVRPLPCQPHRL